MVRMKKVKWLIHKLWIVSAFVIIIIALLLGVARLSIPMISHYESKIALWLSGKFNVPVEIGAIEARWHGFEPGFNIRRLAVLNDQAKPVLTVRQAYVGISIFQSILHRTIILGHLHIDGVNLTLQHALGKWKIIGLPVEKLSSGDEKIHVDQLLEWIFKQPRLELKNVQLDFITCKNEVIPFRKLFATVINTGKRHRVRGTVSIVDKRITKFNFALNAAGNLSDLNSVNAKFHVDGKNLKLVPWQAYFAKLPISITRGNASFKLQGQYKEGNIYDLQSHYVLQNVKFADNEKLPVINRLDGNVRWQLTNNMAWELVAFIKRLKVDGQVWPRDWLLIKKSTGDRDNQGQMAIALKYAKIDMLQQFLTKLPQASVLNLPLEELQLSGEIEDFNIIVPTNKAISDQFSGRAKLKDVGLNQWKNLPTLRGINGELVFDQDQGTLTAYSDDVYINIPTLFDKLFHLQALTLKADWKKQAEAWQIKVPNFYLSDGFAESTGRFNLQLSENKKPMIEMLAAIKIPQFEQGELNYYFPTKKMPDKLEHWLTQAIRKGTDLQATMVLHGELDKFPFLEQPGTFKVQGHFSELDLAYHPEWPLLENLSGDIHFDGTHMTINTSQGQLLGNNIVQGQVDIASVVSLPVMLLITASVQGVLQNGLQFIAESPLNDSVVKGIQGITASGQMILDLNLLLPLANKKKDDAIKVTGDLLLSNNVINVPKLPFPVDVQHGDVHFTEKAVASNTIKATVLHEPTDITLATGDKKTLISAQGLLNIAALEQEYGITLKPLLTGKTPYKTQVVLQQEEADNITITTDWQGIASTLPTPLMMTAEQAKPTTVTIQLDKNGDIRTESMFAKHLTSQLNWTKQQDSNTYRKRGVVQVNQDKQIDLPDEGFLLTGYLKQWIWEDWQPVLALLKEKKFSDNEQSSIFSKNLQVENIQIAGLQFPLTEVAFEKKDDSWVFDFSGSDITGSAVISTANESTEVLLEMDKLIINPVKIHNKQAMTVKLKDIPTIKASCQQCFLKSKLLGQIKLRLEQATEGLRMDLLEVDNDMFQLTAYGFWQKNLNGEFTEVTGQLTTNQLSDILQSWNLPGNVHSRNAKFNFDLEWVGSPEQLSLKALSGDLNAEIKAGWIAGLSKKTGAKLGLGKILNLLSLQSLPKRLSLDFQDITHTGYYFDLLNGRFTFNEGNVFTKDLEISGNVANIFIRGRAGLVTEDYGLKLTVMPHLTSSLPVIATIAGGPVAGAVTWALGKAVSSGVDKMTRYEYLVTGPWQNPVIYPLKKSMHRIPGKPTQQQHYDDSMEMESESGYT